MNGILRPGGCIPPSFRPDGIILDLDGVLESDSGVEGEAGELVADLHTSNIRFVIVTNDIRPECYTRMTVLQQAGIVVSREQWLTPYDALSLEMGSLGCTTPRFFGLDPPRCYRWLTNGPGRPDCVVLGDIRQAESQFDECLGLMQDDIPLFALQKNQSLLQGDMFAPDVGYYIQVWEHRLSKQARVVGKPSGSIYRRALEILNCGADKAAMVSDSYGVDLVGAMRLGIKGYLVEKYAHPDDLLAARNSCCIVRDLKELRKVLDL